MPIYKTLQINSHTVLKIWKITESLDDLLSPLQLKPESEVRVRKMKSELHQRAFISVRHLLASFGYSDTDLYYNESGKPFLKDGNHISISHSYEFAGVIISDTEVGVDIEKQRDKITRIAHKFTGYEADYLKKESSDYIKKLTVIWCVKEALYKLFATEGLSFKQHTLVIPFAVEDDATTAWIDYNTKKYNYTTPFFEFEGFSCAYALPK